jgi:hypothetical protein
VTEGNGLSRRKTQAFHRAQKIIKYLMYGRLLWIGFVVISLAVRKVLGL